ncbi:NACHT domain-containing protein [Fusarium keratoplasticum]|nr:NACHT domain-containing protein [Fusarium keratoplasticum]
MDPITALQTASAIIGIVDFGTRLLSSTYEIYQSASGYTAREVELSTLSEDLTGLGKQLQDRLPAASSATSASDRTLQNLSARCVESSNKLHSAIHDLQANRSGKSTISTAANSFASALKAVWKNDEIESLREELTEIRSQMTIAAIISVLSESKQDDKRHKELKDRLDQIARELSQMTTPEKADHLSRRHHDLVDILWGMDWKSWGASYGGSLLVNSQPAPHAHANSIILMRILRSLSFREINSRKEAIPEAYASTYSWIFRDSETGENGKQLEWPSFPTWLKQRDEKIYWITGKPGSGKSTLMKYIIENPELETHLQEYAGDLPCLQAGFFFWNPGSEMETSREGLLRTLLHQCLKQRPALIPVVAPQRWALYSVLGGETVAPEWTWKELKESFDIFCSFHGRGFRLVLFIDGLDEFKDSEKSPDLLISWIRHTATQYGIKICVSSRPWNVFADAFRREPSLTMQNLSKRDIEHFVRTEFDQSIAFQELKEVFQDEATPIIKEIIEKAQGVFLWVNLVVHNLLWILVDNPSLPNLKRKLAEIPSDIVGLYNAIWRSIPAERQCRSSKILQICVNSPEPCEAEVMWLATEDNPNPQAITNAGILNVMKRIVDGHTRGICELVQDRVQFLHRTAADWVKEDSTRAEICSKAPPDFEPSLNLLEAYIQYQTVMKAHSFPTGLGPFDLVRILFECITRLYHAATADRISQFNVRLIQATDDVNKQGYDFHGKGRSFPEWELAARPKHSTPEGWSTRHWLMKQTDEHFEAENCFAGFAASAGFVDYVKKKLKDDPSLLIPKKRRVSILESAISRQGLGKQPLFTFKFLSSERSYRTGRLEIIRFILETSPHWYETAYGEPMFEAVADLESMGNEPEAAKWRQEVLELLQEFGYEPSKRRKRNQGRATDPDKKASHKKASHKKTSLLRRFKNGLGDFFGKFGTSRREGDSN